MRPWSIAAILLAAAVGMAGPSRAAETFTIAVIDQQAVMERTTAGRRALDNLKEFSASRQRIVMADDEELKRLEAELKDAASGLSDAAKREQEEQFRMKFENYQRRLQEFNREIQAKQKTIADEYLAKIDDVTESVAQKAGYAMVMDKGNDATMRIVIYANKAIDITDQVVKEFDRRFK